MLGKMKVSAVFRACAVCVCACLCGIAFRGMAADPAARSWYGAAEAALIYLSFCGLCVGVRTLSGIDVCFTPAVTASAVMLVLSFAGMLNCLSAALAVLYAAGLVYMIYAVLWRHEQVEWRLVCAGAVLAVFAGVWFASVRLQTNDDYAHWALFVRGLARTDRFPDATSGLYRFSTYPPAAGCWLYYVTRYLPKSDGVLFAAQNFLSFILLLPLFRLCRGRGKLTAAAVTVTAFFLYKSDSALGALVVDWLIGQFMVAVLVIAYTEKRSAKHVLMTVIPLLLACTLVKSSCAFFVAVSAFLLYGELRAFGWSRGRTLTAMAVMFLTCVAELLLWNMHAAAAFPNVSGKHAISATAWLAGFADKPLETMTVCAYRMLMRWLRPSYVIVLLYVLIAVYLFAMRSVEASMRRLMRRRLTGWLCALIVWNVLLYLAYIMSMTDAEARAVAAYDRYLMSMLLPMYAVLIMTILNSIDVRRISVKRARVALIAALTLWVVTMPLANGRMYIPMFRQFSDLYLAYRDALRDSGAAEDGRYLVVAECNDTEVRHYLQVARYELYAGNVTVAFMAPGELAYEYKSYYNAPEACGTPLMPGDGQRIDALFIVGDAVPTEEMLADSDAVFHVPAEHGER